MSDLFTKIKRRFVEPKVYAVVVRTRATSLMHLGVHHTLDEALTVAKQTLHNALPEESKGDHIELFLYKVMPIQQVLTAFYGEKATELALEIPQETVTAETPFDPENPNPQMVEGKNALIQTIIDEKNLQLLKSVRPFLTDNEVRFIKDQIKLRK